MPRARKARLSDDVRAELFARWHIRDMEISKADGVTKVKHVQWGWMPPEEYYQLQKLHDFLPLVEKVIEGGYRLKAALWSIDIPVSVLGSGTEFPLGGAIVAAAMGAYAIHTADGRQDLALLDIASLFLPFGELWLFYIGALAVSALKSDIDRRREEGVPGLMDRLRREGLSF